MNATTQKKLATTTVPPMLTFADACMKHFGHQHPDDVIAPIDCGHEAMSAALKAAEALP